MPRHMASTLTDTRPLLLGVDTSGAWIRAALLAGPRVLARTDIAMARGQGERLFPVLETLLQEAGSDWPALAALGVGIGPGNFTGIRISVAAARGLALGLGIAAIGVSRFRALALDGPALPVLVPAPRDMAWCLAPGGKPRLVEPAVLATRCIAEPGSFPGIDTVAPAHELAVAIARFAGAQSHGKAERPRPLYLREADAAPSSDNPPLLLD